uniref:Reverse transcriptase domain-containing protein n=1 Tax=Tanacetum cinerariifolium TaxID=118510 RepID=A0A699IQW8_TANCI|nr:hypothetical protein [Tanacetum cinerariifolium]
MECVTRKNPSEIVSPLSNPERAFHTLSKKEQVVESEGISQKDFVFESVLEYEFQTKDEEEIGDINRTMADLAKTTRTGASFTITRPALTVDIYKIKDQFLHMIINQCQFSGALGKDVNDHIDTFLGICELFKIKDVDGDADKLHVFPFTLTCIAKEWLKSNAPAPNEAYKVIEDIAVHTHEWYAPQDRVSRRATIKVVEADGVSEIDALTNQMAMFNKKFDKLNATIVTMQVGCESCGGPHLTKDCDDKPMSSSEDAFWVNQRQGNFQACGSNGNSLSYKQGPQDSTRLIAHHSNNLNNSI